MSVFQNLGGGIVDVFSEGIETVGQTIGFYGDSRELAVDVARANLSLAQQKQQAELERAERNRKLVENIAYILITLIVLSVIAAIAIRYQKEVK